MGLADLHIHSTFSDGVATVEAILYHASTHTDLDVIAITDHDTLEGALLALELAPRFRVDVAPGIEVTTTEGHLLALFVTEPVAAGMSFVDTARRVREIGGLPIVAHPFDALASGVGARRLRSIQREHPGLLAGVEVINGSLLTPVGNARAERLRWELGLPGVGGSDAHLLEDIGAGYAIFAGKTAADLRAALEAGHITPALRQRDSAFYRRALTRFALRAGLGLTDTLDDRSDEPRIRIRRA
ncbi:MAG TPA: PHP domain-containing protein [Anaerolineae bacterium]|nr:PHP domain-containing protein [Caldilineae bacterium]HID34501.1 PHP domain-containing protein [Anaerolineae bacterium]